MATRDLSCCRTLHSHYGREVEQEGRGRRNKGGATGEEEEEEEEEGQQGKRRRRRGNKGGGGGGGGTREEEDRSEGVATSDNTRIRHKCVCIHVL